MANGASTQYIVNETGSNCFFQNYYTHIQISTGVLTHAEIKKSMTPTCPYTTTNGGYIVGIQPFCKIYGTLGNAGKTYHTGSFSITLTLTNGTKKTWSHTENATVSETSEFFTTESYASLKISDIASISCDLSKITNKTTSIYNSSESRSKVNVAVQVGVTFYYNNAGQVTWNKITPSGSSTTTIVEGGNLMSYSPSSVSGYRFLGWATSSTATTPDYSGTSAGYMPSTPEDKIFYGVWKAPTQSIAYFKTYLKEGTGWTSSPQQLTSITINDETSTSYNFSNSGYSNWKLGKLLGWRSYTTNVNQSNTSTYGGDLSPYTGSIPANSSNITYYAVIQEKYKVNFYKHLGDQTPYHSLTSIKLHGDKLSSSDMPTPPSEEGFRGWTAYDDFAEKSYDEWSNDMKEFLFTSADEFSGFNSAQKRSNLTSDGYFEIALYGVWDKMYNMYFINTITGATVSTSAVKGQSFSFDNDSIPSGLGNLTTNKYKHVGWRVSTTYSTDYSDKQSAENLYNPSSSNDFLPSGGTINGTYHAGSPVAATISNLKIDPSSHQSSSNLSLIETTDSCFWKAENTGINTSYSIVKCIFTTNGPGTLTVNYNVTSEANWDGLMFSSLDVGSNPFALSYSQTEVRKNQSYVYESISGANRVGNFTYTVSSSGNHSFWIKYAKDSSNSESGETAQVTSISFSGNTITSSGYYDGIQSDLYIYSLEQKKYLQYFLNASNSTHYLSTVPVTIDNYITTAKETESGTTISKDGYAFKGWTIKNNTTYTTYNPNNSTYFYEPNTNIDLNIDMINNGSTADNGSYFYLYYYPVWNPLLSIKYINTLNGVIIHTDTCEKYDSYNGDAITNTALTTDKYEFNGWYDGTDDNNITDVTNPGTNVKGPKATGLTLDSNKFFGSNVAFSNLTVNKNLYSVEQCKYRGVFHSYPHSSTNIKTTESVLIDQPFSSFNDDSFSPTLNKTGYVFKGWTYDENKITYDLSNQDSTFIYPGDSITVNDTLIALSQETDDYFNINFYPVWNPLMNITFKDTLHNLTNTKTYLVEKGQSYQIDSSDYGTGILNYAENNSLESTVEKGYIFKGWVLINKNIDNSDLQLYGLHVTDSYLYYLASDVTSSNFTEKRAKLYTKNSSEIYSKVSSSATYQSISYYYAAPIYNIGDTPIESLLSNLTLYAVWRKKYQVIFKDANNNTINSDGTFYNLNDSFNESPESLNPRTLQAPSLTCTNPSDANNYGFIFNSTINKWESQNNSKASSYSLGRFSFSTSYPCILVLTAQNKSENNFDYGIFSTLNNTLNANSSADTNNVNRTGKSSSDIYKVIYTISEAGNYTFDVKYIKDGSADVGDDKLSFSAEFHNLIQDFQGWTLNPANNKYETVDTTNFFSNDNFNNQTVKDNKVNNTSADGAFQLVYYPVWSSRYSVFILNNDRGQGLIKGYYDIPYNSTLSYDIETLSNNNATISNSTLFNIDTDITADSTTLSSYTTNGYNVIGLSSSPKAGPSSAVVSSDYNLNDSIENITQNLTFYLILKTKYRIQFYKYNRTTLHNTQNEKNSNDTVDVPNENPVQQGWIFKGWVLNNNKLNDYYALSEDEKRLIYTSSSVKSVSSSDATRDSNGYYNINYYSVWNKEFDIKFKDTLHSLDAENSQIVEYNTNINISNLTTVADIADNGYDSLGWRIGTIPTINYTKIADPTSGSGTLTNYGFESVDGKNTIWKSCAHPANNSYSLGHFEFTIDKPGKIIITAQNFSNNAYHYGIFSNLDTALSASYKADTIDKIALTGKGTSNEYTLIYNIQTAGTHYFEAKFINTSSYTRSYCDNLIFNISFEIEPNDCISPNAVLNSTDFIDSDDLTNITSNITLYKIFKKKYRIKFVDDNNNVLDTILNSMEHDSCYANDTISNIANLPTKQNYVFKGWTASNSAEAKNYITRIENNFYTDVITIKDDYAINSEPRAKYTDYFDILFYPVWNQIYKIIFKDSVSSEFETYEIEAGNNFVLSDVTLPQFNQNENAYDMLGWTLRDYTNESIAPTIRGPEAFKDNSKDYNVSSGTIASSLITPLLYVYAIQKKKYAVRFFSNDNSSEIEIQPNYYLNDAIKSIPSASSYGYRFKGWTLDINKIIYDSNNTNQIYDTLTKMPTIQDSQAANLSDDGYFYINYYPVFNPLYTVTYYDIDEDTGTELYITEDNDIEKGNMYNIKTVNIIPKIKYSILGWNTHNTFPASAKPPYELSGNNDMSTSFVVNGNIDLYVSCQNKYAVKIINDSDWYSDEDISNIIFSETPVSEKADNVYYYTRGQTIKLILTAKTNECFKSYNYDNNTNSIDVGAQNKILNFELPLDNTVFNDSEIHEIHYHAGQALKFIAGFQFENQDSLHDSSYFNNNFYLNNQLLNENKNYFTNETSYLEKLYNIQYYYPGDTITCQFSHLLNSAPYHTYYIKQVYSSKYGEYEEEGTTLIKTPQQLNGDISEHMTKYNYTYSVQSDDISEEGQTIKIIPCYTPYTNIIHYSHNLDGFLIDLDAPAYTIKTINDNENSQYEGYIYTYNNQINDYLITFTPPTGFIPTLLSYKDPSMETIDTKTIYDFLNEDNPTLNWTYFYYDNRYSFNTLGFIFRAATLNTYHSTIYELQTQGYIGTLQRIEVICKHPNKVIIDKPDTIIKNISEDNKIILYLNSSITGNTITYSIKDAPHAGMAFKELTTNLNGTITTVNKTDIVDNGESMPEGWQRTQTADHTDIITYTNNNLSLRNGYIDYITIIFTESLPLFYINSKGIQLYWENTKAEGLYWENIKLL